MPRRRILFCTWNYFPAPTGGAEHQARLQAEELTRRGSSVTVVCPQASGFHSGPVNGVQVIRLPRIEKHPHLRRLSYLLGLGLFLLRNVRRFDLIHVHLANLQADLTVAVARVARRPTYVKVAAGGAHGEIGKLRRMAVLTRYFGLRHADRVQALSDEIEGDLLRIGVRRAAIERIPNGLETRRFVPAHRVEKLQLRSRLDLPPAETLVLYAGRFASYKGVSELVALWHAEPAPPATLVLVGGSDTPTDSPIEPVKASASVIVRPFSNSVLDYYRAADIFVLPSHREGMSNALLEAMACGLAVVATAVGATPSFLVDGENGLLVPPRDQVALRAALMELISSEPRRRSLGVRARATAGRYSIETVVDQIERVYESISRRS